MNFEEMKKRDLTSHKVLEGLKFLYRTRLKPVEDMFLFDQFLHESITDSEIEAKPQVLVLGQYSVGKTSFIRYLLGRDFPDMHIGPEPTTDKFVAVVHGEEERVIKGNYLTVVKEVPYSGLSKFGESFLNKFEAALTPSELLRSITLIDTPGVMSGQGRVFTGSKSAHGLRDYAFAEVCEWFADRSDLILLLFDAHKLDINDEFRTVIESIKKHEDKIRCILNKADQIETESLIRVYGALMWFIGRIFNSVEVIRVFVGSFWDNEIKDHPQKDLFERDRADLLSELADLPRNSAVRKINEIVRRIRLLKVHACILSTLRSRMSFIRKASRKKYLIDHLEDVFEEVRVKYNLSSGDLPDLKSFQAKLHIHDFESFPKLSARILQHLEDVLNKDIPELLSQVGGVTKVLKFSTIALDDSEEAMGSVDRNVDSEDETSEPIVGRPNRNLKKSMSFLHTPTKSGSFRSLLMSFLLPLVLYIGVVVLWETHRFPRDWIPADLHPLLEAWRSLFPRDT